MTTTTKVNWQGTSGTVYPYDVFQLNTSWNDVPGNYIFAKRNSSGNWVPLYIGETVSLKNRLTPLSGHENWPCASRNGATHIHAHSSSPSLATRRSEESDLISRFQPACNG